MTTISHREMRNNSAEVLRRVEAGETMVVTNHGHPVARLSPLEKSVLQDLEEAGQLRRALRGSDALMAIEPIPLREGVTTADILADVRGHERGY